MLSHANTVVLRAAAIIQSVESLDTAQISSYTSNISLLDIGRGANIVPRAFNYQVSLTSMEFEVSADTANINSLTSGDSNKTEAYKHYQYLRVNIRAVHIYSMVAEGIDPLRSDIRNMSAYVEQYEYRSSQYSLSTMSSFDSAKLSADIVKNPSINSMRSVMSMADNLKPKSMVTQLVDKIIEEAERKDLGDLTKVMKTVVKTLENNNNLTKETTK